jgi:hypothetical protein
MRPKPSRSLSSTYEFGLNTLAFDIIPTKILKRWTARPVGNENRAELEHRRIREMLDLLIQLASALETNTKQVHS